MYRFFIAVILLCASFFSGAAQSDNSQKGCGGDSVCVLISDISDSYSLATANRIISYLRESGKMEDLPVFSSKTPKEEVLMNVYYYASDYLYAKNLYSYSLDYASKALSYSQNVDDIDFQADIMSLMAINCFRLGNYDRAGYYAEQCYALDVESGDHDRISSSLNTLAAIHMSAKRYEAAETYVLKGIEECKLAGNKHRMGTLLGMASEVYHSKGNSEVALDYAERAYRLEKNLGRESQAMVRLSQRAAVLLGLERYSEAEKDLYTAIDFFRKAQNLQSLGISCNKMGLALFYQDKKEEAAKYYHEAADIFASIGDPYNEMHSHKGLYEALIHIDSRSAKLHYDRYDAIKDSLYTLASAESLSRYEATLNNKILRAEYNKVLREKYSNLMLGLLIALLLAATVWIVLVRIHRRQRIAMAATLRKLRSEYLHLRGDYEDLLHSRLQAEENSSELDAEKKEEESISKTDRAFLDKLVSYVVGNLDSGRLGVEDIASHMCLSSGQLNRRVKTITGNTTQNYVLRLRLEKAKILLLSEPDSPISDIAYRCGFEDAASFSRAFKRVFDVTPTQVRD